MKRCSKCKEDKDESLYSKDRKASSGLYLWCKECVKRKYQSDNKEKIQRYKDKLENARTRTEKRCSTCSIVKPLSDFAPKKILIDGRASSCHACTNLYIKRVHSQRRKKQVHDLKLQVVNKLGGKCNSCGIVPSEQWPLACFDFHHTHGKDFSVSRVINSLKKDRDAILKEASKCIVLCSNCHRKHHSPIFIATG